MARSKTKSFQTETKQLLKLMIHSLYSNKEIFIRELVSNASDAIDKLRFKSVEDKSIAKYTKDLKIDVQVLKEENKIIISDNGIGMNEDEIVSNIGTIARSGTASFLENITGDKKKDSNVIGQFCVGFIQCSWLPIKFKLFQNLYSKNLTQLSCGKALVKKNINFLKSQKT